MLDLVDIEATEVQRGVVACALYRDGQRECDVAVEEIGALAGRDGGIIWLGLNEPDQALLSVLKAQLGLHELMIEDANQAHQRPKLDVYDNVLFIVLRTGQLTGKEIEYGETDLIVGKGFVVSIRHGASASYAEVRQRCERNPELLRLGESAIMYAILDFVGDNYFPIIDKISEELEGIEGDIFTRCPRSRAAGERGDRRPARASNGRFRGEPASVGSPTKRYRQEARQPGRDPCGADSDSRYLRHELQKYAGAGVVFRLSRMPVADVGDLRHSLTTAFEEPLGSSIPLVEHD
jgi:Mg2+ and Co2+ transporter CorA